ncbi:MAG: CARDB domain-containing protein [bacterium]
MGATDYNVYTGAGGFLISRNSSDYNQTSLLPDTEYSVKVTACNIPGCSGFSAIAKAFTVAKPDLVVENLFTTPGALVVGNSASFSGTVKNQSGSPAAATKTRLRIDADLVDPWSSDTWGPPPINKPTGALAVGATELVTWDNAWIVSYGTHRFEICADILNDVIESDETTASNCEEMVFSVATAPPIAGASAEGQCDYSPEYAPGTSISLATDATNCASSDPDGTIRKFEWDFEWDGTPGNLYDYSCCSFLCTDSIVDGACNTSRAYNIGAIAQLRVTDDSDATSTDTVNINICSIDCYDDTDCDDGNPLTKDVCLIDYDPCNNQCSYTPITIINIEFWREILPKFTP